MEPEKQTYTLRILFEDMEPGGFWRFLARECDVAMDALRAAKQRHSLADLPLLRMRVIPGTPRNELRFECEM